MDNGQQIVWKPVKGWEGLYEVSNTGLIKSLPRTDRTKRFRDERILKTNPTNRGYLIVGLHVDRVAKTYSVHRLVAQSFLGDANGNDVNHKDGDKQNNNVENLEYVTRKRNIQHAWEIGLSTPNPGEKSPASKLKESQVIEIKGLLAKGDLSLSKIGRLYGVAAATISDIKQGKTWAVLNGN